jgi:hypothetical protein
MTDNLSNYLNSFVVLNSVIYELLHPFLVVINSYMHFHKKLHRARFASKSRILQEKIVFS